MNMQMKPTIREATLEDVYAIRKFHARSWLGTYPNDSSGVPEEWVYERWQNWDSAEKLQEIREIIKESLADDDHLYRIATVRDRAVALSHAPQGAHSQELAALYVDKEYQGSGLAQELGDLANDFWDLTLPVEFTVVNYNERAKRFYEHQGFRKVPGSEYIHADTMPSIKARRERIA